MIDEGAMRENGCDPMQSLLALMSGRGGLGCGKCKLPQAKLTARLPLWARAGEGAAFPPLVVLEMAQGMARVDHTATYELCDTGLRLAPKLRARVIVCYSTAMRHYCIVWRDAAGGWWIMDDMIGGAVAREIEDEDVADWCRPQDSGWSPVFVIYARVY